ncbi:MAG: helix-turn-helix domain-containing protein [Thauera sp.]|nr:helix-turn-helix domain-containing protein [Thauera sp.]
MQSESAVESIVESGRSSAGAQLRRAREMRGETIGEVSSVLKLAPRQLEALESGHYDLLPGHAFVRGFMRNYARHLGLDPSPLLADVEAVLGGAEVDLSPVSNATGDLPNGGARRASTVPAGAVAAGLLAIVLGGWYFDWFNTESMPPAVEQLAPPAVEPASAPNPVSAGAGVAPLVATPAVVAPSPPEPQSSPAQPAAPVPAVAEAQAPGPAVAPAITATESVGDQLAFRFAGQSWIEVKDGSGAIIYSGTSSAGSTRTVQGKPPFSLIVGNAAQVSLQRGSETVDLAPHTKGSVARLTLQ